MRVPLLAFLLVLLFPFATRGETHCGPQDYDAHSEPDFNCPGPGERELRQDLDPPDSIPVSTGQRVVSEWDGALVHRDRLSEIGFAVKAVRRLRWADRLRLREEYDVQRQYHQQIAEAQSRFLEQQRDAYQERWRAAEERSASAYTWWRSPALWVTVGAVVAVGLILASGWALGEVGSGT